MIVLARFANVCRLLALFALLALGGLNGLHLMHYATEEVEEFLDASALYECFICTTLNSLVGEITFALWCPETRVGETYVPHDDFLHYPEVASHGTGARAPPNAAG